MHDIDYALGDTDTPYGPVVKSFEVEQEPAKDAAPAAAMPPKLNIRYLCPMALLWLLCSSSEHFFQHVQHATSGLQPQDAAAAAGRLSIYFDDVVPGNALRPDKGRSYMAIYWTILELPEYLLQRGWGWFVLAFVPKKVYKKILGAEAQLLRFVLKTFFPNGYSQGPGFSFAPASGGIFLKHGTRGCMVMLRFCCFLADGDAFPKIGDAKSSSSTKPCPRCKNVVSRCQPEDIPAGTSLVHITCGDPHKFLQWHPDELRDLHRYLTEQAAALDNRELQLLEQKCGYKFAPHGLLASDMAEVADLPNSLYMDWMHCICASGGMGQYELNQFLRRLLRQVKRKDR